MKPFLLAVTIFCALSSVAQPHERHVSVTIDVKAPVDTVWSRWTTPSGIRKFFAPSSVIELSTLGRLDIFMNPSAPEGQRGAENNRVLAWTDKEMLSFTWDAPPSFPTVRRQRTVVIVRLLRLDEKNTRVTLTQTGFGNGSDWDQVYEYFGHAWPEYVLPNLKYSCEVGPIDFRNIPKLPPATRL